MANNITLQDIRRTTSAHEIIDWIEEKMLNLREVQSVPTAVHGVGVLYRIALISLDSSEGKDLLAPHLGQVLDDTIQRHGDAYPWLEELAQKCKDADLYGSSRQTGKGM